MTKPQATQAMQKIWAGAGMSEDRFWELVAMTDWPNKGYDQPKIDYLKSLNKSTGLKFRKIVDALWNVLDEFIGSERNPAGGGDDSHSDLLYHIIGLGRTEFYAHLKDYSLMEARGEADYNSAEGYKESFGYAIPYKSDWDNPEKEIVDLEESLARREEEKAEVNNTLITYTELSDNINEALMNADGAFVAEIYNKICSNQIEYCEDDNRTWKEKV